MMEVRSGKAAVMCMNQLDLELGKAGQGRHGKT